jgi:DNA-binding MarR family transcriptional regulator
LSLQRAGLPYLHELARCPRGCTYNYLQLRLKRSKSAVTRALAQLVESGFVVVYASRGRGQKAVLKLTEQGQRMCVQLFSERTERT